MEFFTKTPAVRLKSHLNRYLTAGEDQSSTRQSRCGDVRLARWLVELVDTNPHVVRLKSCHGRYLTASAAAAADPIFLGRKVHQTLPENPARDLTIEWQPIRDGFQVKLKAAGCGTYLRANGAAPPWRNMVTHGGAAGPGNWLVWDVEAVEVAEDEAVVDYWSMVSSLSPVAEQISGLDIGGYGFESPVSVWSPAPATPLRWWSMKKNHEQHLHSFGPRMSAIDLFQNAKTVRLKGSHGKYLVAEADEVSVTQERSCASKSAKWEVEFVESSDTIIRLKSCYGKYLTASNQPFLFRMTGRKVLQTLPPRLDSSVEWEPIRERGAVKLKTRYGRFLRANGSLPPWRNSITHDIPHRTVTKDWIFWEVHVVEFLPPQIAVAKEDCFTSDATSPTSTQSSNSASFSRQEWDDSCGKASDGRLVYFELANEHGEVENEYGEVECIAFKGFQVSELASRLEDELGIPGLTVCTRSPLNRKLHPLRLHLPPNNATMHVVVLPPSSKVGEESEEEETEEPVF
ncbi:uncharacterized protein LOC121758012 isoform X1 [Salvia splendens]|uniref:uncharacterized protein LOC121758012 isoform X1 n=1 Tax=Salvia splendens TaxID=180675 RepID=UPI001C266659|nr:uncharacterized protein LOC121758012 isoform X1 [Salvia splendens]